MSRPHVLPDEPRRKAVPLPWPVALAVLLFFAALLTFVWTSAIPTGAGVALTLALLALLVLMLSGGVRFRRPPPDDAP